MQIGRRFYGEGRTLHLAQSELEPSTVKLTCPILREGDVATSYPYPIIKLCLEHF